jgi:hypothetical protein
VTVVAVLVAIVAVGGHDVVLILVLVGCVIVATGALLLEAGAVLVEDPEIMLGELQPIFGLHAVALKLRIAGERLVLLQELRRVAARAGVLAVADVRRLVRRTRSAATAAATAAVLTIVYQM